MFQTFDHRNTRTQREQSMKLEEKEVLMPEASLSPDSSNASRQDEFIFVISNVCR